MKNVRGMRGAVALSATLVMLLIVALLAAQSAGQVRQDAGTIHGQELSMQAEAAAEGGAQWALALLNAHAWPSGCGPNTDDPVSPFREQVLAFDAAGHIAIQGNPGDIHAACQFQDGQWHCRCRPPIPVVPGDLATPPAPSFQISLQRLVRPGAVRLTVHACSHPLGQCSPGQTDAAQASVEQDLALYSALRSMPRAALTASGPILFDDLANPSIALPVVRNASDMPATLIVQTGAGISGNHEGLDGGPGIDPASMVRTHQPQLLASKHDTLFQHQFGVPSASYSRQAAMRQLTCQAKQDCSATLNQAQREGARLMHVQGSALLHEPLELGNDSRPVILYVDGDLRLEGAARLNGLLVVNGTFEWINTPGQESRIEGAVICFGHVALRGPLRLDYSPALLQRLRLQQGTFVQLPGGWTSS